MNLWSAEEQSAILRLQPPILRARYLFQIIGFKLISSFETLDLYIQYIEGLKI